MGFRKPVRIELAKLYSIVSHYSSLTWAVDLLLKILLSLNVVLLLFILRIYDDVTM